MSYGDMPPSYWPLISKLKGKSQEEQDRLVAEFIEKQQRESETPLTKYITGELSEEEYFADHHPDPNERLRLKSRLAEAKRRDVFKKKT